MKAKVLIIIFSVLLAAISCAFAESSTTTEAAWPQVSTESPPASQWSWVDFFKFIKNSTNSGNKFYFFF